LNQWRFDRRFRARHGRAMHEINETPRNVLVAALFCAIIGIIVYAGLDSGMAGPKAKGRLAGSKIPAIRDEAR
jgi:hypothetical protein